jgi:hypothetical protein
MKDKPKRKRPSMPDRETRERQAKRRLGTERPACCHCGFSDWRALQRHHAIGQAYDGMTVIECANCHAILTDGQNDHPPCTADAPSMFDRIGRLLVNLADFFAELAKKLMEYGEFLLNSAPLSN